MPGLLVIQIQIQAMCVKQETASKRTLLELKVVDLQRRIEIQQKNRNVPNKLQR